MKVFAAVTYSEDVRGNPQEEIASQLNVVQGIFANQVDLDIIVEPPQFLSNNNGLTSTDPSTLLSQFQRFMQNQGNPGLGHLFTGNENLRGGTAGIAYLSAVCRNTSVGVS